MYNRNIRIAVFLLTVKTIHMVESLNNGEVCVCSTVSTKDTTATTTITKPTTARPSSNATPEISEINMTPIGSSVFTATSTAAASSASISTSLAGSSPNISSSISSSTLATSHSQSSNTILSTLKSTTAAAYTTNALLNVSTAPHSATSTGEITTNKPTSPSTTTTHKTTSHGETTTSNKTTSPGEINTQNKASSPAVITTARTETSPVTTRITNTATSTSKTSTTDKATPQAVTTTDTVTSPAVTTKTDTAISPAVKTTTNTATSPAVTTITDTATSTGETTTTDIATSPAETTTTDTMTSPAVTTTIDTATSTGETTTTYKATPPDVTTITDTATSTGKTTITDIATSPAETTSTDTTTSPAVTTMTDTATSTGETTTTYKTTSPAVTTTIDTATSTGKTTTTYKATSPAVTTITDTATSTGKTITTDIATSPAETTTTDTTTSPAVTTMTDTATSTGETSTTYKTTSPAETTTTHTATSTGETTPSSTTTSVNIRRRRSSDEIVGIWTNGKCRCDGTVESHSIAEVNIAVPLRVQINATFSADLTDHTSTRFMQYKKEFTIKLTDKFKDIKGFQYVLVQSFTQGSVVCNSDVVFQGANLTEEAEKSHTGVNLTVNLDGNNYKLEIKITEIKDFFQKAAVNSGCQYVQSKCDRGYAQSCDSGGVVCVHLCSQPDAVNCGEHGSCVFDHRTTSTACRCIQSDTHIFSGELCEVSVEKNKQALVEKLQLESKLIITIAASVGGVIMIMVAIVCLVYRLRKKAAKNEDDSGEDIALDNLRRSSRTQSENSYEKSRGRHISKEATSNGSIGDLERSEETRVLEGMEHKVTRDEKGNEVYIYQPNQPRALDRQRLSSVYSSASEDNAQTGSSMYDYIDTETKYQIRRPNVSIRTIRI